MSGQKVILLISGKRKCGKDFLSEKLGAVFGETNCFIVRISEPIKSHYAKENNLDLQELMSENVYKEKFRSEMIKWSDSIRASEPGYFCKAACSKAPIKSIWIVSDVRRTTDINWFKNTYGNKIKTLRITANLEERKKRGWVFTAGVDDVTSECDLDDYESWDLKLSNNNQEEFELGMKKILNLLGY